MTKLSKNQIQTLSAYGIDATTEEEARPIIIKRLAAQEIDGVDNDVIQELIDMMSALEEQEATQTKATKGKKKAVMVVSEPDADEEEMDELAREVEGMEEEVIVAKKTKKVAPAPAKKAAKPLAVVAEVEAEEEEEDEVITPKAKTVATKKPATPTKAKAPVAPTKSTSAKFDVNNADHLALIEEVKGLFVGDKYLFTQLAAGLTVRLSGNDSTNRALLTYNGLKVKDGQLVGELALNGLRLEKGIEVAKENIDEDYTEDRLKIILGNLPLITNVTQVELKKIATKKLLAIMEAPLVKLDGKLNQNRKKMEEAIVANKKTATPAAKVVTKKK
jgi:hypothetical protein